MKSSATTKENTMILKPFPVPAGNLTYDRAHSMFVGEVSDVRLERVYDDACDVGFTLRSPRTGREIVMVECASFRDTEGELVYTDFEPAEYSERGIPGARVRLFND